MSEKEKEKDPWWNVFCAKERAKAKERQHLEEDALLDPKTKGWRFNGIHDLEGKVFLVTGANAGLGYETTRHLGRCNARVIMACRNKERGQAALNEIKQEFPKADLDLRLLDLSKLDSVKAFAAGVLKDYKRLDVLINNAGIGWGPEVIIADCGTELTIATNCVGPFLLTGLLLPLLDKTPGARIVTVVSSYAFKADQTSREDLSDKNKASGDDMQYRYFVSKSMNITFAQILADKLKAAKSSTISVFVHPGFAKTEFTNTMEKSFAKWMMKSVIMPLFAQSAEMGSAPLLMAATDDSIKNGDFIGPSGANEAGGWPHHSKLTIKGLAADKEGFGKKSWGWLEEWSGFKYGI